MLPAAWMNPNDIAEHYDMSRCSGCGEWDGCSCDLIIDDEEDAYVNEGTEEEAAEEAAAGCEQLELAL